MTTAKDLLSLFHKTGLTYAEEKELGTVAGRLIINDGEYHEQLQNPANLTGLSPVVIEELTKVGIIQQPKPRSPGSTL